MRAILIDPEKKAVTEIQLADGSYLEMQRVLQCRSWTTGAH
jgi:putative component of membrane protein insertase Oxa1/YidC/SpoIIIJ protein YidD